MAEYRVKVLGDADALLVEEVVMPYPLKKEESEGGGEEGGKKGEVACEEDCLGEQEAKVCLCYD